MPTLFKKRRLFVVFGALISLVIGTIAPYSAKALSDPWTASLATTKAGQLLTHADGSVSAVCSSTATHQYDATQIDRNGNVTAQVPTATPQFYSCNTSSAVGKDGAIYGTQTFDSYGSELVAYKNGAHQWTHRFLSGDTSCASKLRVAYTFVGSNGNIYVGLNEAFPWCNHKSYLGAITPSGQELYVKSLNANFIRWMGIYDNGIATMHDYNNNLRYFDLNGDEEVSVDLQLSSGQKAGSSSVIDVEGNVYVPISEPFNYTNSCRTNDVTKHISIYSPGQES